MSKKFLGEYNRIPTLSDLRMHIPAMKLVLFDMDGTLIDSEPIHAQAFLLSLHRYGITLPEGISRHELVQRYKGLPDTDVVEKLKQEGMLDAAVSSHQILEEKHHALLNIINTQKMRLHQDMMNLLNDIESAGLSMGIVTASERQVLDVVVDALGIRQRMHVLLGRQDTHATKPHPAPYLEAMVRMKAEPMVTVILEDSTTGLSAADASGAHFLKAQWFN